MYILVNHISRQISAISRYIQRLDLLFLDPSFTKVYPWKLYKVTQVTAPSDASLRLNDPDRMSRRAWKKGVDSGNRSQEESEDEDAGGKDEKFKCTLCLKVFSHRSSLSRHAKSHRYIAAFVCHLCNVTFSRQDSLGKHLRNASCRSKVKEWECEYCEKKYAIKSSYTRHTNGSRHQDKVAKVKVKRGKEKESHQESLVEAEEMETVYDIIPSTVPSTVPDFTDSEEEVAVMESPCKYGKYASYQLKFPGAELHYGNSGAR